MVKNVEKNDRQVKKTPAKMDAFTRLFYDANFRLNSYVEALKAAEESAKSAPSRRAFNRV